MRWPCRYDRTVSRAGRGTQGRGAVVVEVRRAVAGGTEDEKEWGRASLRVERGTVTVCLGERWRIGQDLPKAGAVEKVLRKQPEIRRLTFDAGELSDWDSSLLTFLRRVTECGAQAGIAVDASGLPEGVRRLLALAGTVPQRVDGRREEGRKTLLTRVGLGSIAMLRSAHAMLGFVGEICLALVRLAKGRARCRGSELFLFVQQGGAGALPIVTLISVLVGLILAFVGAMQLQMFGAEIYIANLVGIGMARDMGAMMTGIIMAGRTGAAYAAQIGTMQVNEEVDALRTLGISPVEFLVLPRVLALAMMMPLLTVYADLMGIVGGALAGVGLFDISPAQFYQQTRVAVPLHHFGAGLIKSAVYGIIVALAGCLRGMECGRSASAVGEATTSAVVTAIVGIIIACAVLTVMFHVLGV